LASPGETVVYSNPYYAPAAVGSVPYVDYSQPIATPAPVEVSVPVEVPVTVEVPAGRSTPVDPQTGLTEDQATAQEQAVQVFDQAGAAFRGGNYAEAQSLVEKAIARLPGVATLHEFRALTLFAQKKYQEASTAVYAVLAAGPGWDWQTLKGFYPDVQTYTTQLRDLEQFQRGNPDKGYASLLLAYHYLTLESFNAAAKQLQIAVKVEPKDQLSAQLLAAVQKRPGGDERPRPQGG
jgi:Tfp pilus assembly protein PilF